MKEYLRKIKYNIQVCSKHVTLKKQHNCTCNYYEQHVYKSVSCSDRESEGNLCKQSSGHIQCKYHCCDKNSHIKKILRMEEGSSEKEMLEKLKLIYGE